MSDCARLKLTVTETPYESFAVRLYRKFGPKAKAHKDLQQNPEYRGKSN